MIGWLRMPTGVSVTMMERCLFREEGKDRGTKNLKQETPHSSGVPWGSKP
jgi:hypothetical protein